MFSEYVSVKLFPKKYLLSNLQINKIINMEIKLIWSGQFEVIDLK